MTTSAEQVFTIRGMDCAGCARTVEGGVAQLSGVELSELTFTSERLRVRGTASRAEIIQRVRDLGYDVAEEQVPGEAAPTPTVPPNFFAFMWAEPETRLALVGALLMIPGLLFQELLGWDTRWIDACSLLALGLTGFPIARSAWQALRLNHELSINGLMTIAAIGALFIGATTEAGMVMVLFAIGEALEGYTGNRARYAIRSLMEVAPEQALRLSPCCGEQTLVRVEDLHVGDQIVVRPGERIPMDGVIRAGASLVNQAPITGESRLIEKEPGSEVLAGTMNGDGSLEVEVTRLAANNTIRRMIRMVEEAQERRAPVQRIVDRFAHWYTPAVVGLAILVATIPTIVFGQPFWNPAPDTFGWFYRSLALLVVACPCALVISTPVTIVSALSAAARGGVLIKGGAYLEALSRIQAIAFDKTGTLTTGKPAVVEVHAANCNPQQELINGHCDACDDMLALAYAVEQRSEHPLAHAIVSLGSERGLVGRYPVAEEVRALTGRGVSGRVGGRDVLIGSHGYFDANIPHNANDCGAAQVAAAEGYTPVMVSAGGNYMGMITVADSLRPTSIAAIDQLKALGLRGIAMLTGDERSTAERIASEVGVTDIRAELLPEQKVAAVEALQQRYGPLAMVGDGINDTPALATASVGIAIGGAHGGTNQAMETADITLMSDDLRHLPFAIRLSRATMRTVGVNIAFSIGIKVAFLLLVLAGIGTMWMAVFADVGTALLVTLNGMRMLGYRGK